jgi:DNA-binding LacI/PurR family transcriptional regulator
MKININEVAKRAGVSIATVSRAFNGNDLVREETRTKILEVARQLNYIPNPIARSLSRQATDTIGVVLPDLVGEFFMDIIHGIDEEAYRQNWYVLVSSSHSQRNIIETLIEFMGSGRVDGVILMAPQMHKEVAEIVLKSKRPVVLINACEDLSDIVNFKINNFEGAFNTIRHLVEVHGFRKIGIIKGPEGNCDSDERFAGYIEALNKLSVPSNKSFVVPGDFSVESGYNGFLNLIRKKERPDAIFASNDMMAVGAYKAAAELGMKIPDDVALVGFDDIYLSQFLTPRLTTVHVPLSELGRKAVQYLLDMVNGKVDKKEAYSETIPTELKIGGSCGCSNFDYKNKELNN